MSEKVLCKICLSACEPLFTGKILKKYHQTYYKCNHCNFIQLTNVFWLSEAYENSISDNDTGYVTRNLRDGEIVKCILQLFFKRSKSAFLDYGGGYGLFTRLMRDNGYNFLNYDRYTQNLFAKKFKKEEISKDDYFNLITAFEVLEHLDNPAKELSELMNYTDTILFSTELVPNLNLKSLSDWWYFAPDNGQHISFYSKKALTILAKKLNARLYTNNKNLHMITRKKFIFNPIYLVWYYFEVVNKILGKYFHNRKSLINKDTLIY